MLLRHIKMILNATNLNQDAFQMDEDAQSQSNLAALTIFLKVVQGLSVIWAVVVIKKTVPSVLLFNALMLLQIILLIILVHSFGIHVLRMVEVVQIINNRAINIISIKVVMDT